MRKKYRILSVLLCLCMVMAYGLSACGSDGSKTEDNTPAPGADTKDANDNPADADITPVVINYASNDAPGSVRYDLLEQKFADLMKEKTGGRIEVEIFPSGSLSKPGAALDAMKDGTVDTAMDSFTRYSGQFLYYELLCAPGLKYNTSEDFTDVINEYVKEFPDASMDNWKIIVLNDTGNFGLVSAKKIESVSQLKGLQIRNTPQFIPLFNKLGASSVDVASGDMYEALRLSTIAAANTNDHAIPTFNLAEVCNYFTALPIEHADFGIFMSMDLYNSFDAELRGMIDEVCVEMQKIAADYITEATKQAREKTLAVNPNFEFTTFSDSEIAKLSDDAQSVLDEMAAAMDSKGLKGTEALAWLREHQSK